MRAPRLATVTWRDDTAPHQIRLTFHYPESSHAPQVQMIAVSCTCMATGHASKAGPSYRPITARACWDDPAAPMAIWRAHMAGVAS
jgi:hypothetical protein